MGLRITTLVENAQGEHLALRNEHGISFYLEKEGRKLLFDTGQSSSFIDNAAQLRIDLADLQYVVLSHGHYDHTGGLRALTEVTHGFELVTGQGFFDEKFGFVNNSYEYLGNNFDQHFLAERGIDHRFAEESLTELLPGVFVVTGFTRSHPDEGINPRFRVRKGERFETDRFDDEVLIAVDSPGGLVVLLGCSHPGMKNMLDSVRTLLDRPLYAVLGGTHLVEAGPESLELSLGFLKKSDLELIGVSHCTGKTAMDRLSGYDERYFHNRTGSSIFVES